MTEPLAVVLLLLSALFSALHRLIIKQSDDRLVLLAGFNAISIVIGLVAIWWVPPPPLVALIYLMASSAFYTAAMYFLAIGYNHADFSVITPLQSAIQVVLIAFLATFFLGENPSASHWIAAGLIVLSYFVQVAPGSVSGQRPWATPMLALAIGLLSGCQYISDVAGIRTVDDPMTYVVWNLLIGWPICVYATGSRFETLVREFRYQRSRIFIAAFLDTVGYAFILWVVYRLAVLSALPLINLDIVFATLIGLVWLGERSPLRRIAASVLLLIAAIVVQVA